MDGSNNKPVVATLVRRNLPVIRHDIGTEYIDHVIVEIISAKNRNKNSLFVLNVYSNLKKKHSFANLASRI